MNMVQLLHSLRRSLLLLLLLPPMMFLGACNDSEIAPPDSSTQDISGLLIDNDGNFVPEATLQAVDIQGRIIASDTSNAMGAFSLIDLPSSSINGINVKIFAPMSSLISRPLAELLSDTGGISGLLVRVPGEDSCCNSIVVNISSTNAPLAGVEVRLRNGMRHLRTALSDSTGRVRFNNVCDGNYNIRLSKSGYNVVEEDNIGVDNCDSNTVSLSMALTNTGGEEDSCCDGRAYIVARDSNSVLSGATIRLWRNGVQIASGRTSSNGTVGFEDLCEGRYGVDIAKEGYRTREFSFEIGCNDTIERSITILEEEAEEDTCCQGRLQIYVRDTVSGNVIVGATVRLWRGSQQIRTATTNANGYVVFEDLCEGNLGISALREGYAGREAYIEMDCNDRRELTLRLRRNTEDTCCTASMLMKVKDSTVDEGGWLSGVTVTITRLNTTIATGTTNGDGRYVREELCGYSSYTVTFSKEGYRTKSVTFTYEACRRIEETIRLAPN